MTRVRSVCSLAKSLGAFAELVLLYSRTQTSPRDGNLSQFSASWRNDLAPMARLRTGCSSSDSISVMNTNQTKSDYKTFCRFSNEKEIIGKWLAKWLKTTSIITNGNGTLSLLDVGHGNLKIMSHCCASLGTLGERIHYVGIDPYQNQYNQSDKERIASILSSVKLVNKKFPYTIPPRRKVRTGHLRVLLFIHTLGNISKHVPDFPLLIKKVLTASKADYIIAVLGCNESPEIKLRERLRSLFSRPNSVILTSKRLENILKRNNKIRYSKTRIRIVLKVPTHPNNFRAICRFFFYSELNQIDKSVRGKANRLTDQWMRRESIILLQDIFVIEPKK